MVTWKGVLSSPLPVFNTIICVNYQKDVEGSVLLHSQATTPGPVCDTTDVRTVAAVSFYQSPESLVLDFSSESESTEDGLPVAWCPWWLSPWEAWAAVGHCETAASGATSPLLWMRGAEGQGEIPCKDQELNYFIL